MANGRPLRLDEAIRFIDNFRQEIESVDTQLSRPGKPLAIGQKIDLAVLNKFLAEINKHPQGKDVDAIRIYLAKSPRHGDDFYDVVIVPVLKNDIDLHKVYPKEGLMDEVPTILGDALPCPNVCPGKAFFC